MPNLSGSSSSKRDLLTEVIQLILLNVALLFDGCKESKDVQTTPGKDKTERSTERNFGLKGII